MTPRRIFEFVVDEVSVLTDVSVAEILGRRRTARIASARLLAYWVLSRHADLSYSAIGRLFDRDHSTILAGVRRHEAILRTDETAVADLRALLTRLDP